MTLDAKNIFLTFLAIAIAVLFAALLARKLVKAAAILATASILFAFGFGWLPDQLGDLLEGEKTIDEIFSEIFSGEAAEEALESADELYDGAMTEASELLNNGENNYCGTDCE